MMPYLRAFLYDQHAFQRYMVGGAFLLGAFLESGGVVPGTSIAFHIGPELSQLGSPLKALSLFLAAGGSLPSPPMPTMKEP
jgi:hypothetical protein